jgi:hypothetical protein
MKKNVPCQVCCFITKTGSPIPGVPTNPNDPSSGKTWTPCSDVYAVVRVTAPERVEFRNRFESILLNRWEKTYYADGEPVMAVIPALSLGQRVFVVQDFAIFFETLEAFLERRKRFIDGDKEECVSTNGKRKYRKGRRTQLENVASDALACDWAYSLAPADTWPFKYFDIKEKSKFRKDQIGVVDNYF